MKLSLLTSVLLSLSMTFVNASPVPVDVTQALQKRPNSDNWRYSQPTEMDEAAL